MLTIRAQWSFWRGILEDLREETHLAVQVVEADALDKRLRLVRP
jgi:hypothetical protein